MALVYKYSKNLLVKPGPVQAASRTLFFDKRKDKGPDPIDHATGKEKLLLILKEKGYDDPYMIDKMYPRGPATKDKPCLVPSFAPRKIVACYCQEDQTHLRYMWLTEGEDRRCECGHYFRLVPATDLRILAYGKKEDSPEMF